MNGKHWLVMRCVLILLLFMSHTFELHIRLVLSALVLKLERRTVKLHENTRLYWSTFYFLRVREHLKHWPV